MKVCFRTNLRTPLKWSIASKLITSNKLDVSVAKPTDQLSRAKNSKISLIFLVWVALVINISQKQIRPNDFRPNFLPHDLFLYSNDVTQKPWRKKMDRDAKKLSPRVKWRMLPLLPLTQQGHVMSMVVRYAFLRNSTDVHPCLPKSRVTLVFQTRSLNWLIFTASGRQLVGSIGVEILDPFYLWISLTRFNQMVTQS